MRSAILNRKPVFSSRLVEWFWADTRLHRPSCFGARAIASQDRLEFLATLRCPSEVRSVVFSEEERREWLARKRRRERPKPFFFDQRPVGVCVHCAMPFGMADGTVIGGIAICDDCEECQDF
ncbi:hypothetical protein J6595_07330 [Jiella sp. KSK16Y-1]|uniref:Uncharacterized protein n=1 Tax=Jiella mangrovi TaxID=2821407 RepID=A0ABS4BF57_9HYPH|nr:hypothetical protein [Jiella mangrovi]